MRKLWILTWKSVRLAFRDRGAVVMMLILPLVLTLIIAAAFGGGRASLSDIPVLVVNYDDGSFGEALIQALVDTAPLLAVTPTADEAAARAQVDTGEAAALVIIPAGLSEHIFPFATMVRENLGLDLYTASGDALEALPPEQQQLLGQLYYQAQTAPPSPVTVEIYGGREWPISVATVRGIVRGILERMHMTVQGVTAVMGTLIQAQVAAGQKPQVGPPPGAVTATSLPIHVTVVVPRGRAFSWLDYSAVSMALFSLMFTIAAGGRALLEEDERGTLPRLLVTPTSAPIIIIGEMGGIALTGLLQMVFLWAATTILIDAWWGPPLGVAPALVGLVLCATGMGALITAWSRTPRQAGAIGMAISLIGAAFSGSFFPRSYLPAWMRHLSLITPNAWGIELFSHLQSGATFIELLPWLGGMAGITALYFIVALVGFRRRFA